MVMRLLVTTLAGVALAAGAPAASAAALTHVRDAPISGPVVAGGEAVWARARADDGFDLLAATMGAQPRTLRSFPSYTARDGHSVYLDPALSAYGDRIALSVAANPIPFSRYEMEFEPTTADVLSGPLAEPLGSVLHCEPGINSGPATAVGERGVIASGPDCDAARAGGLAFTPSGAGPQPLTPNGARPRAAGHFVGWMRSPREVTVYDLDRRAVSYRAQAAGTIRDWDLQSDGKVAISSLSVDGKDPPPLAWYSPEEQTAHFLPGSRSASAEELHMAGDRIAYLHSKGTSGPDFYFDELGVVDLAGSGHVVATRALGIGRTHASFAFDGSTITWSAPECLGATLRSQAVDEPGDLRPRPTCSLALRGHPRMLGNRAVRVRVRCSGFVLPSCAGSSVRLETARGHLRLGGEEELRFCDLTADVPLSRRGRMLVRTRKALRVRAIATVNDVSGRREVRARTFTLRTRDRIAHPHACEDEF